MGQQLDIGDGIGAGGGVVTATTFTHPGGLDTAGVGGGIGLDLSGDNTLGFDDPVTEGQRKTLQIQPGGGRYVYDGAILAGDLTVFKELLIGAAGFRIG